MGELPIVSDDQIYLRLLQEEDINDTYLSWFSDEIVTSWLESRNIDRAAAIEYLRAGKETGNQHMFAVCDKTNHAHIGNLKIGPINFKYMLADLVTVIGDRSYWGRGVATRAIRLGNSLAFNNIGILKLHGAIISGNTGSIKAYTNAGWVIEGCQENHYFINGSFYDRVIVSCFSTKQFPLASIYAGIPHQLIELDNNSLRLISANDYVEAPPPSVLLFSPRSWAQHPISHRGFIYEGNVANCDVHVEICASGPSGTDGLLGLQVTEPLSISHNSEATIIKIAYAIKAAIYAKRLSFCSAIPLSNAMLKADGVLKKHFRVNERYVDGFLYTIG